MLQTIKNSLWNYGLVLGMMVVAMLGLNSVKSFAIDITLTGNGDEAKLREALTTLNADNSSGGVIYFDWADTTKKHWDITITEPLPTIKKNVTLTFNYNFTTGKDTPLVVLHANQGPVFFVDEGRLDLEWIGIYGGTSQGGDGGGGGFGGGGAAGMGGGVFVNQGTLYCFRCYFDGCKAIGGDGGDSKTIQAGYGGGGGGFGGDGAPSKTTAPGVGGNGGQLGGLGGGKEGNSSRNGQEGGGGQGGYYIIPSNKKSGGDGGFGGGGGGYGGDGGFGGGGGADWNDPGNAGSYGGTPPSKADGGGGAGLGGAIFVRTGATLQLVQCNFSNNQAVGGSGGKDGQGLGGAIFLMSGVTYDKVQNTFSGNTGGDEYIATEGSTAFPPISADPNWMFYE